MSLSLAGVAVLAASALAGCTTEIAGIAVPLPSPGQIQDLVHVEYALGSHVAAPRRVAYDRSPPFGGAHDQVWAACNGVVYDTAVRTEHMIHSLEHGAVWIAYDPARVSGADLDHLVRTVEGKPYRMLSPYPGLDRPVSVQSWGYQLKLDSAQDPRLGTFIAVFRNSPEFTPEFGATCDVLSRASFDQDDPPPFDPSPPGPDALPVVK